MTYNVFGGTLNPAQPQPTLAAGIVSWTVADDCVSELVVWVQGVAVDLLLIDWLLHIYSLQLVYACKSFKMFFLGSTKAC